MRASHSIRLFCLLVHSLNVMLGSIMLITFTNSIIDYLHILTNMTINVFFCDYSLFNIVFCIFYKVSKWNWNIYTYIARMTIISFVDCGWCCCDW